MFQKNHPMIKTVFIRMDFFQKRKLFAGIFDLASTWWHIVAQFSRSMLLLYSHWSLLKNF